MDLIGHLSKCNVAFAMYIYVHYNYRVNEIIFFIFRDCLIQKKIISSKNIILKKL